MEYAQPSLNTWTIFFLLAVGQGLFLSLMLFLNPKGNQRANRLLGLFILLFAVTLLDYLGYWTRYHYYFPYFASIYEPIAFLFGPLLLLYFRSIESSDKWQKIDGLHFLPFILFVLYRLPYFTLPYASKAKIITGVVDETARNHLIFPYFPLLISGLIIAHLSIYAVWCIRYLKQQGSIGSPTKADSAEQIRSRWYKLLVGLYIGFVLSYLFYYIMVGTPYFSRVLDYSISLAMTVFIYVVGFLGHKRPEIFSGHILQKVFLAPKYQNSSLTPSASQSLLQKLKQHMQEEKPFLDNELRLGTLATQLQTSTHHLSQVINEQLNQSFSDFINSYRIEAAKKMLADPRQKQVYIINIAYAAGFNNKTSFNKAFKEQTGMSPSEFRKTRLKPTAT